MKRNRKAKIVATLGPSSSSPEMIKALFEAGVDVFRLNFSHGSHEDHRQRFDVIRSLEAAYNRPTTVLLDLQGPKLRIGQFQAGSVMLAAGQSFRLDQDPTPGTNHRVQLPHPEIYQANMSPGASLLLDDGRVRLEVIASTPSHIDTRVVTGGMLSARKGVNVPDTILPLSPLTAKDIADLEFGLSLGVDWIALSFVQRASDIEDLRARVGGRAWLIAKIEKPKALESIGEIVQAADAVMVARGDLGVELPPQKVPVAQRAIIRECRQRGRPVIVATQMLESMISSPIPTRAEASDVATAIYEGADAVMLSGETAMGAHPLEAVSIMAHIIAEVESDTTHLSAQDVVQPMTSATPSIADALALSLREVARALNIPCAVTYTDSGATCLSAARERLRSSILALTPKRTTARRLGLVWGTHCVLTQGVENVDEMTNTACAIARAEGLATAGDTISITAGLPFGEAGTTNLLRMVKLA
jgi:pyruvate kinase